MNKDKINNVHCKTSGLQALLQYYRQNIESKFTQVQTKFSDTRPIRGLFIN